MVFFYIFLFILGLLIGSFLNVLIVRHNTGISIVNRRSHCFSCGKTLSFFELIPVVSFLLQRGKCRNCRSRISIQYPLVEIISGGVFLFLGTHVLIDLEPMTVLNYLFLVTIFSILLVISIYDIKHKIIPDFYVYLFILLSIIYKLILYLYIVGVPIQQLGVDAFSGVVLFIFFFLFWYLSKGMAMGFGDGKLAAGIGVLLGMAKGIVAVVFAFWTGAVVGIILLFLKKRYFTMKSEVPFAPFLAFGALLSFLVDVSLF